MTGKPPKPSWLPGFAKRLKTLMAERSVSRASLADSLGVDPATVSQWRGGKFPPTPERLDAIARLLGVTTAALQYGSGVRESATASATGDDKGIRVRLAQLRLELTEAGATDVEVGAALALIQAPEVAAFSVSDRGGRSDATLDDQIAAIDWLAAWVLTAIRHRHGVTPVVEDESPKKKPAATDRNSRAG